MKADPAETRGAWLWFFGAGTAAIILSIFLWRLDDYLTTSRGEMLLGSRLKELRTAQILQEDRSTDERQFAPLIAEGR